MRRITLSLCLSLAAGALACSEPTPAPDAAAIDSGTDAGPPIEPLADYGAPGPYAVGSARTSISVARGMLPVELWFPAAESARADAEAGHGIEAFEAGTANETEMGALLAAAPDCVRRTVRSSIDAPAIAEPATFPAIVFSHCHACVRFDVAAVAERLASHGIVVAAPDHVGNTLWDARAGMVEPVGNEFLMVRAADVGAVLDALLDGSSSAIPADLRGRIDPDRVGMMGHSFGAATTGLVVTTDDRFVAALAIAAPVAALGGVRIAEVGVPTLWLLAREDNSILEIGNRLIRTEHMRVGTRSWLVEVDDAGHWSFADIAGLDAMFMAGCGEGVRQTVADEPFTYLDPDDAREIASDVAASFFAIHLLGDPGGETALRRLDAAPAHVVAPSL